MFKQLTKAEEQIMQVLWQLEQASTREILEKMPAPVPHYNTVSTLLKILESKGFVAVIPKRKAHIYHPLLSRAEYGKQAMRRLVKGYFGGSIGRMLSCFAGEDDISLSELQRVLDELKNE